MRRYYNVGYFLKARSVKCLPESFPATVFDPKMTSIGLEKALEYRARLLLDQTVPEGKRRSVADIVSIESTRVTFGGFLQKLIEAFSVSSILELGTSVGVGTAFLACTASGSSVTTVDRNPALQRYAGREMASCGIENVHFVCDEVQHFLNTSSERYDLVFVDSDHCYQAMLAQYSLLKQNHLGERYIIVFDDINYKAETFSAWKAISAEARGDYRLNLFRWGVVFHGYGLPAKEQCIKIKMI